MIRDAGGVPNSRTARETIAATGCRVRFLPPDSPGVNPSERALVTVTQHPRRAEPGGYQEVLLAAKPVRDVDTASNARGFYPLPEPEAPPLSTVL